MKKITDKYIAGLFDGEGCVSIRYNKKRRCYWLGVSISNNYLPVLIDIQRKYKGTVITHTRYGNNRQGYSWIIGAKSVLVFLNSVLPHLRIKREEVEIGLRFQNELILKNNKNKYKGLSVLNRSKREVYKNKMHDLKKRSW